MEQRLKTSLAGLLVTSRMFNNAIERVWEQLSCWEMDADEAVDDIITVERTLEEMVKNMQSVPEKIDDIGEILKVAKEGVVKAKMMDAVNEVIKELKKRMAEEEDEEEEDAELD